MLRDGARNARLREDDVGARVAFAPVGIVRVTREHDDHRVPHKLADLLRNVALMEAGATEIDHDRGGLCREEVEEVFGRAVGAQDGMAEVLEVGSVELTEIVRVVDDEDERWLALAREVFAPAGFSHRTTATFVDRLGCSKAEDCLCASHDSGAGRPETFTRGHP